MNNRNFRKLLAENMRRFRTKNLYESGGSLQQASTDEPKYGHWTTYYNYPIRKPSVGGVTMWWQDVFASIARHLGYYSQQIKQGTPFSEYASDIVDMYKAIKNSYSKVAVAFPWFNDEIIRGKQKWLIEKINDDILEEIKQLLQNQKTYPVDVTSKNMLTIANSCQDVSEDILHLGWDYGWQDDPKRNAKTMSVIAQN